MTYQATHSALCLSPKNEMRGEIFGLAFFQKLELPSVKKHS